MKNRAFLYFIFSMAVLVCTACSDDSDAEMKITDPVDFTEQLTHWNWDKIEPGRLYVIRSAEEYALYGKAASEPLPEIDFTKYSLLSVKGEAHQGIHEIIKKWVLSKRGSYWLDIQVRLNGLCTMEKWRLGVLVPVIPKDKKVDVEISYLNL